MAVMAHTSPELAFNLATHSPCIQAKGESVAETLQQEEQRLTDARSTLEAICVPPVLTATLASLQAALAALQGQAPHSAGGFLNSSRAGSYTI